MTLKAPPTTHSFTGACFVSAVANFYGKHPFPTQPFFGCLEGVSDRGIIDSYFCPTTSRKAEKFLTWDA